MNNYESIWIKNPNNLIIFYDNFSIFTPYNSFNAAVRCLIIVGILCVLFKRHNWSYMNESIRVRYFL